MKTFREFMLEATADIFGDEAEQARVRERDAAQARRRAARTGMSPEVEEAENKRKAFEKSGLSPEEARRRAYRNVKVSSQDAGFGPNKQTSSSTQKTSKQPTGTTQTPPQQPKATQTPPRQQPPKQPSGSTQTPPRGTQTPPKQPKASTPPPKPPTSSGLAPVAKPSAAPPKGPGLRSRLGSIAGPAVTAGLEYKDRRDAGQSKSRAAGGALTSLAGYAKGAEYGAKLGARLPIPAPMWVKAGAGGLIGGVLGQQGASAAYDFAADKTRPARQAISKATGFDKFQQKNELLRKSYPGSSPAPLSAIARAQQTVDTRSARAASSAYGTKKGSALTGIGGNTFVSKDKKGAAFMSTGPGSQRKTVELAKTQLVRDPKTGKQVVGDLAFKDGKAVYLARPSVSSRNTSLSARLGRALNIGRFTKEAEQQAAKQEYRTALRNTQAYTKKLGISTQSATKQGLPGYGGAKPAPKPSTKSAQAYAASKGKYYSSTTGKTYANYAAALKDPSVKAAASKK